MNWVLTLFFSLSAAAATPERCDFTAILNPSVVRSTADKAKAVASRDDITGIVSEIGAGQEIARALLDASPEGGVVHESRSDYKTGASDALYGSLGENAPVEDYASRRRLVGQLDTDFDRVPRQPGGRRFALADATETSRGNGHGWLGIKAELRPGEPPVTIQLHVRLAGARTQDQKQDLAALGVNLIHALYENGPDFRLESLLEGIPEGRASIDFVSSTGARVSPFELLRGGKATGIAFEANGAHVAPQDLFVGKDVKPIAVRLTEAELNEGAKSGKFLTAQLRAKLDQRPVLVLGPGAPDETAFLTALSVKDRKPRAAPVDPSAAEPRGPLEKAARLNLERQYVMTLIDLGGRQGMANYFFDARNVGILFRSENRHEGKSLEELLGRMDTELRAIESKRPHRKAVVGNVTLPNGEGFVVVRGQVKDQGGENLLVVRYRRGRKDSAGALAVNALYAFAHPHTLSEATLGDGLEGIRIEEVKLVGPDLK